MTYTLRVTSPDGSVRSFPMHAQEVQGTTQYVSATLPPDTLHEGDQMHLHVESDPVADVLVFHISDPAPRLTSPPETSIPGVPFKLRRLADTPQETWIGRPVFHPCGQADDVPEWSTTEYATEDDADGPPIPLYDVGVVTRFEPDPHFADLGGIRVWFVGSRGSMLHYDATNLWTPT